MKKYLFLIILTIIALNGFAQDKTNANSGKETNIFRQPDLEKFYGTWLYEKDGIYFVITLERHIFINSEKIKHGMEFLKGTHVFKQNGKIVDEKDKDDKSNSIGAGNFLSHNKNLVSFRFKEYKRAVVSSGTMEYIEGSTPKLIWKLNRNEYRRGIILPGQENLKDPEFIVPTDIILHKVK